MLRLKIYTTDFFFEAMDKEVGKTGPQKSIFRDIGYPNVHDLVGHHAGHTAPAYGAMSSYGAVDSSKVPTSGAHNIHVYAYSSFCRRMTPRTSAGTTMREVPDTPTSMPTLHRLTRQARMSTEDPSAGSSCWCWGPWRFVTRGCG